MGRRTVGVLLTALIALVVAVLLGRGPVAGRPLARPPAPPPAVGDCLVGPGPDVTAADLQACDGPRFGEVVAVGPAPGTDSGCADAVRAYVGLPAAVRGIWTALPALATRVVHPTAFQAARGQSWAACVAVLGDAAFPLGLAHLLDQWIADTPLSLCTFDPGVTELRDAQCSAPHRTEVLGAAAVAAPLPDLAASCRVLAAAATRMPDPGDGGALTVEAVVSHAASPGRPDAGLDAAGRGTAVCRITAGAGRDLSGSLLGLGTRPVPWA